jgi:hypothetical protein
MYKITKCKNCQYTINHYIDIIEYNTNFFFCQTCNTHLFSNKLKINNHKKECCLPIIKEFNYYFCTKDCFHSYFIKK